MAKLSVKETAKVIGITPAQVRWLIRGGKLRAGKRPAANQYGYTWEITTKEAEKYRDSPRKTGPAPKKQ